MAAPSPASLLTAYYSLLAFMTLCLFCAYTVSLLCLQAAGKRIESAAKGEAAKANLAKQARYLVITHCHSK